MIRWGRYRYCAKEQNFLGMESPIISFFLHAKTANSISLGTRRVGELSGGHLRKLLILGHVTK
jgi:hypothetical protein